ncbi:MAG: MOSC domain-containing protein [Cytophagales bacterium]|nr:MAG: MOSC domain-containing protein [Cytophagales bacterium]
MKVKSIHIYPIKSCGSINLQEAQISPTGFLYDRNFMLVDTQMRFLSQREYPQMAHIQVEILSQEATLKIDAPHKKTLYIAINDFLQKGYPMPTTIWNDTCTTLFYSAEADQWFSDFLGIDCRLTYLPSTSERIIDPQYNPKQKITSLSDGYPFLLTTEASLDDLNQRLENPITMQRFRPNIVIEGVKPFEEDQWKTIKIGDLYFDIAKPCARCQVITIDPQTAEVGKEPLKTLSTFRKKDNKVLFGQNLIHQKNEGSIKVGDTIEIIA